MLPSSVLIQPGNRGTAPASLYSLMRLSEMDPKGVVAFFPSDHYFADEEAFVRQIDSAYAVAAMRPEVVILLGILPENTEVEYGWIEPGGPLGNPVPNTVCHVRRFWKNHVPRSVASDLMERGCMWNSFIMTGHVSAFSASRPGTPFPAFSNRSNPFDSGILRGRRALPCTRLTL